MVCSTGSWSQRLGITGLCLKLLQNGTTGGETAAIKLVLLTPHRQTDGRPKRNVVERSALVCRSTCGPGSLPLLCAGHVKHPTNKYQYQYTGLKYKYRSTST